MNSQQIHSMTLAYTADVKHTFISNSLGYQLTETQQWLKSKQGRPAI